MALRDPLSVAWYRYARWARAKDVFAVQPRLVDRMASHFRMLARKHPAQAEVLRMMSTAVYRADPFLGPPVGGRLTAEEHKARCMTLLHGQPPTE